mmetsp:Transcript_33166/g.76628  ORF Transcript_33166/g.76628 Transcript_33166/m.76628 type:complete len:238 (-) Transcript_33166:370-1083(-)
MFGGVADNWKQNNTHESVRERQSLCQALHRACECLRQRGHQQSRHQQQAQSCAFREGGFLLLLFRSDFYRAKLILMCDQLEYEVASVENGQDNGAPPGDQQLTLGPRAREENHRGDYERQHRQQQQGILCPRPSRAKSLGGEIYASAEEAHAKNEQKVRHNAPDQAALHDLREALTECEDGNDHLHSVAEGGVQQTSQSGAHRTRQLLGGFTQQLGQGDNSQKIEEERGHLTPAQRV